MLVFGLEVPVWVTLTLVTATLLYWYGTSTFGVFKAMRVPQMTPYPFLGNVIELLALSPYELVREMQQRFPGKFFGCFHGRTALLSTFDVEFVKQLTIKEFPNFMNRRDVLGDRTDLTCHLPASTDEHWKHVRSLLSPTFTSGKLKQMYPAIDNCADKLVAHLKKNSSDSVFLKRYMENYTMDVIATTAFGIDIDAQTSAKHPFVTHAAAFFGLPVKRSKFHQDLIITIALILPRPIRILLGLIIDTNVQETESMDYFRGIISSVFSQQQQQSDGKHFIAMCSEKLVDVEKLDRNDVKTSDGRIWTPKGLTKNDIVGNSFAFFSAGYETTATSLHWFFYNMALHPDIQEKLHDIITDVSDENGSISYEKLKEMEYLDWCINESLRIFPPVVVFDRVAKEKTTIKGINIPEGMVVSVMVHAIHLDPDYWPEPERYNPERFSPENKTETQHYAFLPFGIGNRSCIAQRLAMLELRLAIVKMMSTFRFTKTATTPEYMDLKFTKATSLMQPAEPIELNVIAR